MMRILFITLLLISACSQDDPGIRVAPLDQEILISVGESVEIVDADAEYVMMLTMTAVNDNRCPVNAACITAGSAVVNFQVNGVQEISRQFELCVGAVCADDGERAEIVIDGIVREFILKDVRPYPGSADSTPKYSVLEIN